MSRTLFTNVNIFDGSGSKLFPGQVLVQGNRIKAEQLFAAKSRGAKILIAPCHNCHSGLEDINHHYGLGLEVKFISDILYEVMEKPV